MKNTAKRLIILTATFTLLQFGGGILEELLKAAPASIAGMLLSLVSVTTLPARSFYDSLDPQQTLLIVELPFHLLMISSVAILNNVLMAIIALGAINLRHYFQVRSSNGKIPVSDGKGCVQSIEAQAQSLFCIPHRTRKTNPVLDETAP